ncbi:MAG: hypothetical protein LBT65_07895 [Synergistaceae bacterium]|jgi:hypothetical protein|nr:hypothetical protein [Synergistaceae bacterium]
MRRLLRSLLLALVIALATWLVYIGREHQVFLDNKTIEAGGQSFRALKFVKISVNGGEPIELMPRDRDLALVVGPAFKIRVEVMDEWGEEVEKTIDRKLTPGFSRDMMLSMPLLAAEREDWILPSPTAQQTAAAANEAPPAELPSAATEPLSPEGAPPPANP